MAEPVSRRPRGRPRLSTEAMTPLSVRVPVEVADKLCSLSARRGVSVSAVTSQILIMALAPPGPPKDPPE